MQIFKAKSLDKNIPDDRMTKKYGPTRYLSFEHAIQIFLQHYKLTKPEDAPIGYRVTEDGIEILEK